MKQPVKKIIAKKKISDEDLLKIKGTLLPTGYFTKIIREDTDVLDEYGNYILRFRKNVLNKKKADIAYDNLIDFAKKKTDTRGMFSSAQKGSMLPGKNPKIATNIIGFFDTFSMSQKKQFRDANVSLPNCRPTYFVLNYPDKFKKIIPFVEDIGKQYKKLFPNQYKKQFDAVQHTKFSIGKSPFSTLTTNLNVQGGVHTDTGDFSAGFGNLVVLEKGKYRGGYTGFPQYKIAVDVRQCDFLAMNVHLFHANTPITGPKNDIGEPLYHRLSIVSYLRQGIVDKCGSEPLKDKAFFDEVRQKARAK